MRNTIRILLSLIVLKNNTLYFFLGNMSNPTINRWGLNLFWYRFWYNDKNSALTIQQDDIINKLILLYIHFGLLTPKNLFINSYWYSNYAFNYSKIFSSTNLKYFRIVEYKNKINDDFKSYKIRNKIKNLYFSKIWILRYQNWLIINFYCFQPLTIKKNKKLKKKKDVNFYLKRNLFNIYSIRRYKKSILFLLNSHLSSLIYYKF